jgi:anti-anti-sigma factor
MEIKVTQQDKVTIVSAIGSIDALTAETLLNALIEQVNAGALYLIADLSGVDYTSSAGLRAILGAQKEIRQQGGDLRLAGVQPVVLKVLKLSGFTNIFKMFDDVSTAIASFSE